MDGGEATLTLGTRDHRSFRRGQRPRVSRTFHQPDSVVLVLIGAFSDCAIKAPSASSLCTSSTAALNAVITLHGRSHDYLLYIAVNGTYSGPGVYDLPPWPHPSLDVTDVPKVALREYATGTFWQSVAGVLRVISQDGRSGFINAEFTFVGGEPTPSIVDLRLSGSWRC